MKKFMIYECTSIQQGPCCSCTGAFDCIISDFHYEVCPIVTRCSNVFFWSEMFCWFRRWPASLVQTEISQPQVIRFHWFWQQPEISSGANMRLIFLVFEWKPAMKFCADIRGAKRMRAIYKADFSPAWTNTLIQLSQFVGWFTSSPESHTFVK